MMERTHAGERRVPEIADEASEGAVSDDSRSGSLFFVDETHRKPGFSSDSDRIVLCEARAAGVSSRKQRVGVKARTER